MDSLFASLNYWAILVSALVYWIVGAIWFTSLGKIWTKEIKKHGITLKKHSSGEMTTKFIVTFILNFLIAWAIALVVYAIGISTLGAAIGWGLLLGIGFSALTIGMAYFWESRTFKLTLIDVGYPIIGILLSTIIIALWR